MFLIHFVVVQMALASAASTGIHCSAQQTAIARDQVRPNNAVATLNATTLLQQLPSNIYRFSFNNKNYRPHYSVPQQNTPAAVAKYRNLGNYYQDIEPITTQTVSSLPAPTNNKVHRRHTVYNIPIRFENHVLHLDQKPTREIRPRRVNSSVIPTEDRINYLREEKQAFTQGREPANKEAHGVMGGEVKNMSEREGELAAIEATQSYHDIFMRYNGPHQTSFGHVEYNPHKNFQKRFESLNSNDGNRHRGEIVWTDAQGGYGEHHWDLLQGKLR